MSLFVGIDYDSSEIHVATIDETTLELVDTHRARLDCGPGTSYDRARRVRDLLPPRARWKDAGVLAIGIEDPYTRQLNSLTALIRVQGALLATLPRDLPVIPLRPQHWKIATLGKGHGNADKPAVIAWALEQGCPAGLSEDFYDAFAIARATALDYHRTRGQRAA